MILTSTYGSMEIAGRPTLELLWKPTVQVGDKVVRPDALVRLKNRKRWVMVEIDEDGPILEESKLREALLGLPTVRLDGEDLLCATFVDRLRSRVVALAA